MSGAGRERAAGADAARAAEVGAAGGETAPGPSGLGWRGLVVVAGVALLVRVAVAEQLASTVLYRTPQLDALEYLEWARRVAGGDFSLPLYPTHGPVYPFFLGALLALLGGSLRAVRWVQAVVGAGTCALVADLGCRLWRDRRAGLASGLWLALYAPLVLVDTELWEEGLFLLFLATALWWLAGRRATAGRAGLAGLALGAASAIRPTALVLVPLWAGVELLGERRPRRGRTALALLLGTLLVFVPVVAAVSHAAGTFLLVRGFGAVNVWIGNDPAGGGVQNARLGGEWERVKNMPLRDGVTEPRGLESYFTRLALARARQDPWGFVRVQASKLWWLTQSEEPRDNHSFYFFREQSSVLALLPGFGLLFAGAVVGGVTAVRRRLRAWHLATFLIGMAASVAVALVGLRYRLPMVLALAVFAGGGLVALWDAARARRLREFAILGALFLGALLLAHTRRHPGTHVFAEEWALAGSSLETEGKLDEAEAAFRRALDLDPTSALGWDGIGRIRIQQGHAAEAEQALGEALARDPDQVRSHFHLGQLLVQRGEIAAGLDHLRAALAVAPRYTPALEMLAQQLLARGAPEEAAPLYERLAQAEPRNPAAYEGLARVAGVRNDYAAGVRFARRATDLAPERVSAWQLLGYLAVQVPDLATAREALSRLEALGSEPVGRHLLAAAILHAAGDWAGADRALRALLADQPGLPAARSLFLTNADRLGRRAEAEAYLQQLVAGR